MKIYAYEKIFVLKINEYFYNLKSEEINAERLINKFSLRAKHPYARRRLAVPRWAQTLAYVRTEASVHACKNNEL